MAQVIQFEEQAVVRLRERLGAVEEANQDLIAFARGHSGAVASIHSATLAAIEASSIDALLRTIAFEWPSILGIDSAALALVVGQSGFHASSEGVHGVETAWVARMLFNRPRVEVRAVGRGHALFGVARSSEIRAEALIRIDSPASGPCGLLALGQREALEVGDSHASELLLFLGRILASSIRRIAASD